MPMMLARISADTGPRAAWVEERRSPGSANWVIRSSADDRVFQVPTPVLRSLQRAGVKVPPPGQVYEIGALDKQLVDAGLDLQERLQTKVALGRLGLLPGA
jgi:hypothetical protein